MPLRTRVLPPVIRQHGHLWGPRTYARAAAAAAGGRGSVPSCACIPAGNVVCWVCRAACRGHGSIRKAGVRRWRLRRRTQLCHPQQDSKRQVHTQEGVLTGGHGHCHASNIVCIMTKDCPSYGPTGPVIEGAGCLCVDPCWATYRKPDKPCQCHGGIPVERVH